MFSCALGQKPVSSQAARAYLRGMLQKAGIDKKISPHKLRHTYATNLLNAGAELVDMKALLGHESVATTQIYTNVGPGVDGEGGGKVMSGGSGTQGKRQDLIPRALVQQPARRPVVIGHWSQRLPLPHMTVLPLVMAQAFKLSASDLTR